MPPVGTASALSGPSVSSCVGPGPSDGSSVMWMYHSHTDEVSDTYAGLMGPIEITVAG